MTTMESQTATPVDAGIDPFAVLDKRWGDQEVAAVIGVQDEVMEAEPEAVATLPTKEAVLERPEYLVTIEANTRSMRDAKSAIEESETEIPNFIRRYEEDERRLKAINYQILQNNEQQLHVVERIQQLIEESLQLAADETTLETTLSSKNEEIKELRRQLAPVLEAWHGRLDAYDDALQSQQNGPKTDEERNAEIAALYTSYEAISTPSKVSSDKRDLEGTLIQLTGEVATLENKLIPDKKIAIQRNIAEKDGCADLLVRLKEEMVALHAESSSLRERVDQAAAFFKYAAQEVLRLQAIRDHETNKGESDGTSNS